MRDGRGTRDEGPGNEGSRKEGEARHPTSLDAAFASPQQRRWNFVLEAERELCEKIIDMQRGGTPLSTLEMAEAIGMALVWWCARPDEGR